MNELCTSSHVLGETCRYLGYGTARPSEPEHQKIREVLSELKTVITPRLLYQEFPLSEENGKLLLWSNPPEIGTTQPLCTVESRDLSKNLSGCSSVLLFAATLGSGVDALLLRYGKLEVSRAAILQAASAAVLEEFCDRQNGLLKEAFASQGLSLRPRFSPGYGDLPLEFQKDLFRILNCQKHIGLTLTDSLLMSPSKSVTALIGVSKGPASCEEAGCRLCNKTDCTYRKEPFL